MAGAEKWLKSTIEMYTTTADLARCQFPVKRYEPEFS